MSLNFRGLQTTGIAALSLATLLACGTITGCGGGNKNNGGSGATSGGSGSSGVGSGATSGTAMSGTTSGTMSGASSGTMPPPPAACATPTFSPAPGTVAAGSNVVISDTGLPADASIHFTTDGSTPTDASPVYNNATVGVQVMGTTETFSAIASGTTCSDSAVATAMYTITPAGGMPEAGTDGGITPPTPTFTPGGTMTTQPNDFTVAVASMGATNVCYTLGTTAPTCAADGTCGAGSMTYATAIPISATGATAGQVEVQAIGCGVGSASAVGMSLYTLQVATPTMTPPAGAQTYSAALMGVLATATTGATINYTTNGTAPTCGTAVAGQMAYTAPFALQAGSYQVIACKMGYKDSTVAGPFAITVNLAAPTITPAAGSLSVAPTFTVTTAGNPTGSWICYSTSATVPACGAAGVCMAGTLLPANGMFTGATDGSNVQAIACAPAGLSNSTVTSQGPYKLQLAPPLILPDATTVPAASYTLTNADGADVNHLNIVQASVGTATDQAGAYLCWLEDPGVGIVPACGPNSTCLNGSNKVTPPNPDGPTDIEPNGPFGAGDSVAVVTCPGTTIATGLGFEGSAASTTVFVGQGQAQPPTPSATDTSATQPVSDTMSPWFSKVNVVLTNPNAAAMTVCYTTDGTTPACTPGSAAAGCATVDGTSSQNLNFKITAAGVGYVNPPMVTVAGGGGTCTGAPTAALTAGAVTSITATGCAGYTTPPSVTLNTGAGAKATGTASETVTFIVSDGGAGYMGHVPTVNLIPADGVGSCAATAHVTGDAVTSITTAAGCTFDANPTVTFDNTAGGGGAVATAHVAQTVALTVTMGGQFYTANPVVTGLTPTTGTGGACTALNAVETAGVVTSVTATGCSGFADVGMAGDIKAVIASQGPTDGTANAAAAIALPGNSISLPAIETNPTTVNAIACNAGLGSSPVVHPKYNTQLQDPTIVATDTLTGNVVAGVLTAGDTLTISTTSNFTDTKLVYTTDGTTPTCAAGGTTTTFTGASTTIPVPVPQAGQFVVKAIACGANQLASAVQPATFTSIDVAAPVVTSAVGTVALGTGTDSTGPTAIHAQNVVTATIKSPTPNSYICYSTNGSALTCAAAGAAHGCPGNGTTLIDALTGPVTIGTSGTTLTALACVNGNASPTVTGVTYTLAVTPAVLVGMPTAACPSVATIGFDYADTNNTTIGGPTTGAKVCYSLVATPAACATGGDVTCSNVLTAANPTTAVMLTQTGPIYTLACNVANFTTTAVQLGPETVTPYAAPAITVDGVLNTAEWSGTPGLGDQFPTAAGGATRSGFTFGAAGATMFFSQSGFTPALNTYVMLYLTDETAAPANGVTTTTRLHGGGALPFRAEYAIEINTHSATGCALGACTIATYQNTGGAGAAPGTWTALGAATMPVAPTVTAASAITAGVAALEASVPTASFGPAGHYFDVAGEVFVTGAANPTAGWSVTKVAVGEPVSGDSSLSCDTPLLLVPLSSRVRE